MKELPDQQILDYLQSGQDALQNRALRYLYKAYYGLIENMILKNSGSHDDVPDVFQNGLIVFFNKTKEPGFQLSSTLKTYLYSICRNLWLMEIRKNKRNRPLEDQHEFIPIEEDNFETLVINEKKELMMALLQKMGESCRKVLIQFYYKKMRMAQIKDAMNYNSEQVAKNKKRSCMQKLRKMVMDNPNYVNALKE